MNPGGQGSHEVWFRNICLNQLEPNEQRNKQKEGDFGMRKA